MVTPLDHPRSRVQRISCKHRIRMAAFVVADLPEGIRSRVATCKRSCPGEDQSAFDDARIREAVIPAIDLVEVQRVAVSSENRQLHVLALADGVADAVEDHVAGFEV